ncbi:MAG: hypothetical protein WBB25_11360 [Sulfitobacter sp.]
MMIAFFLLPALLGLALFVNLADDDDDAADDGVTEPPVDVQVADDEDAFIGSSSDENITARDAGGYIDGGDGNDKIVGSEETDILLGGAGNDVIFAQGGNDYVSGDAGDDRIFLGDGDDAVAPVDDLSNLAGDDLIRGGAGNDLIGDFLGSNQLFGDLGSDTLVAFDGLNENGVYERPEELGSTDTLSGGFGNDILAGDDGDIMTGGEGRDTFYATDSEDVDLDEVTITDFNTAEDNLFIVKTYSGNSGEVVGLDYDSEMNGVRVTFEGRAIAFLSGVGAADIPAISTFITTTEQL